MSVSICWRPSSDRGKPFKGGTSSSLGILKDVFGERIDKNDVAALRAMAKATKDEFYDEVADVIESVGAIEVWGEY